MMSNPSDRTSGTEFSTLTPWPIWGFGGASSWGPLTTCLARTPPPQKKKRMFKKLLHEPWIHGRCGTSVSGDWIPQHYKFMPVLNVYTHAFEFVLARAHPSIIYQITPIAANVPVDTGGSHLALPLRWLFSESTSLNGGRLVRIHSKEWGDMGTVIMASADEVVTERN